MPQSPDFAAIVEVGREPNGGVPSRLIAAAYRASQTARVMLVLDSVSRAEVDAVLDDVVTWSTLNSAGVLYADLDDDATVLPAATRVPLIFARSQSFMAKLRRLGVSFRDSGTAEQALSLASARA